MTNKLIDKIKAKACPHCKAFKLLAGPAYDRLHVRCQNCGADFRFKAKVPGA